MVTEDIITTDAAMSQDACTGPGELAPDGSRMHQCRSSHYLYVWISIQKCHKGLKIGSGNRRRTTYPGVAMILDLKCQLGEGHMARK